MSVRFQKRTVEFHVASIYEKLGVNSLAGATIQLIHLFKK
ncbi:MAG: hypothetical protein B6D38_12625 [Anaerolineae bacterium UTCFX1]|nr:MAG: hypothetical protein B6D38_12625 [Anaerolineae bacterium UTCFX1]